MRAVLANVGGIEGARPGALLTLSNTGRESTEVGMILLTFADGMLNGGNSRRDGPPLPYTLVGHSGQTWTIDLSEHWQAAESCHITVRLGHGHVLTAALKRNVMPDLVRSSRETPARHGRLRRLAPPWR